MMANYGYYHTIVIISRRKISVNFVTALTVLRDSSILTVMNWEKQVPLDLDQLASLAKQYNSTAASYAEQVKSSSDNEYINLKRSKSEYLKNLERIDLNGWFVQARLSRLIKAALSPNTTLSEEEKEIAANKMLKRAKSLAVRQAPASFFSSYISRPIYNTFIYVLSYLLPLYCVNVQKYAMNQKAEHYARNLKQAKNTADGSYNATSSAKRAFKSFIMNAFAQGYTATDLHSALETKFKDSEAKEQMPERVKDRINYYATKYDRNHGYYPMKSRYMESAQGCVEATIESIARRCTPACRY